MALALPHCEDSSLLERFQASVAYALHCVSCVMIYFKYMPLLCRLLLVPAHQHHVSTVSDLPMLGLFLSHFADCFAGH